MQLRFGINQKIRRGNDALASTQSLQHDKAVADAQPGFDLARLKVAVAVIYERNPSCAGLQHTRSRYNELCSERHAQGYVDVHSWLEQ